MARKALSPVTNGTESVFITQRLPVRIHIQYGSNEAHLALSRLRLLHDIVTRHNLDLIWTIADQTMEWVLATYSTRAEAVSEEIYMQVQSLKVSIAAFSFVYIDSGALMNSISFLGR